MSKEKLDELKDRIAHHFKNELEIMRDILKYLNENEAKELQKFMNSHSCTPNKAIDRIVNRICH